MQKYLIFLFVFIFPISLNAKENNYFLMLKNKKVNVRYGPSFDYPIKYVYRKIELPLKVIDKKENFRRIIDHKKNGFLASPFNKKKFAQGIIYCLKNCGKKNLLNNRKKIVKMFDQNKNLNEYSKVIKSLLKSWII